MVSAKLGPRRAIEDTIEHLISVLDLADGDPDFEDDPLEEQHDREAELEAGMASLNFVLAEMSRRVRLLLLQAIPELPAAHAHPRREQRAFY